MAQTPATSPLRTIAQQVLSYLAPLAAGPGARIRAVRFVDRIARPEDLFSASVPALVLTYNGSPRFEAMSMGRGRQAHHARWALLLCVGSLSSEAARVEGTSGDNGEAGLLELIELVRTSLQARLIGSRALVLARVDRVYESPAASVWGFELQSTHDETAEELAAAYADLASFTGAVTLTGGGTSPSDPPATTIDVPLPTP